MIAQLTPQEVPSAPESTADAPGSREIAPTRKLDILEAVAKARAEAGSPTAVLTAMGARFDNVSRWREMCEDGRLSVDKSLYPYLSRELAHTRTRKQMDQLEKKRPQVKAPEEAPFKLTLKPKPVPLTKPAPLPAGAQVEQLGAELDAILGTSVLSKIKAVSVDRDKFHSVITETVDFIDRILKQVD